MIFGLGNVAVDCARILLRDPNHLAETDVCDHALRALRSSAIRRVALVGQKGRRASRLLAEGTPRVAQSPERAGDRGRGGHGDRGGGRGGFGGVATETSRAGRAREGEGGEIRRRRRDGERTRRQIPPIAARAPPDGRDRRARPRTRGVGDAGVESTGRLRGASSRDGDGRDGNPRRGFPSRSIGGVPRDARPKRRGFVPPSTNTAGWWRTRSGGSRRPAGPGPTRLESRPTRLEPRPGRPRRVCTCAGGSNAGRRGS